MIGIQDTLRALELHPAFAPRLENFVVIFKKWNNSINLSAARSIDDITEHVLDSLHVVPHLRALGTGSAPPATPSAPPATPPAPPATPSAPPATPSAPPADGPTGDLVQPAAPATICVLDVGSGGGLPVVVAAICLPDIAFTSLEPVHKKHAFLRTAARELGLPNLDPRAERLEQHSRRDYDAAMSRATFDLLEWLQLGLTHVRLGGQAIGFEATPRDDLPAAARRYPYQLTNKTRAIVTVTASSI